MEKKVNGKSNNLIGSKIFFKNIRCLNNNFKVDSAAVKIIIFASAECGECEDLINELNRRNKEKEIKNAIIVLPASQDSLALKKYNNIAMNLFRIEEDSVIKKIKFVPTFLFVEHNVITKYRQGEISLKEILTF